MNPHKQNRMRQMTGLCAVFSCISTVVMSGFCIATLAINQADQKQELIKLKMLHAAVVSVTEASCAFDGQTIAWNSLVLHAGSNLKERSRFRSAFAQQSRLAAEAMESVLQQGRDVGLPIECAENAADSYADTNTAWEDRMSELRIMNGGNPTIETLRELDRAVNPQLQQTSFRLESVAKLWSDTAATLGTEYVSQSVASIGRMKAWLEILALITTAFVLATAVLAVLWKEGAKNDRT